eukprot:gi/632988540/ref/XP_007883170.1/ PREDICTED: uncharacterized protein C5orf42-like [Callorhinchus milii]
MGGSVLDETQTAAEAGRVSHTTATAEGKGVASLHPPRDRQKKLTSRAMAANQRLKEEKKRSRFVRQYEVRVRSALGLMSELLCDSVELSALCQRPEG